MGLLGPKSDVSGYGSGTCHEGWLCVEGAYASSTYVVEGMQVSTQVGQSLMSMGAASIEMATVTTSETDTLLGQQFEQPTDSTTYIWLLDPANNASPAWAATKTFFNGLIHGVRQPGQTLGECVNQNVSDTTFGKVDPKKLFNQGLTTLETTATLLAATKLPTATGVNVAVGPYLAGQLARALGQGAASTAAFIRVAAGGMQALAVTGAATAGLAIGSAINCR